MEPPLTRYAKSRDVRIAYQVVGSGPLDLVFVPGFISNIESFWEQSEWADFFSRLAAFSRLILFDKRGTGLSDRDVGIASLEERMDDVRAVTDAIGSERFVLFGYSDGGVMSILFAATYPQRVRALVLYGCFARSPFALLTDDEWNEQVARRIDRLWGTGEYYLNRMAPSRATDQKTRRFVARYERLSASPSAAITLMQINRENDVRHLLPAIHLPTLVIHLAADSSIPVAAGRELADNIAGAKYVELSGGDHWPVYDHVIADRVIAEIEEFLTGSRSSEFEANRVLATVMFTDIVDSTKRAAELGDRQWRALRERHDDAVRQQLARFRGHEVKNLGDGFLATFDGPARAVRCAAAIADAVQRLGIAVRIGIHTGEIDLTGDDVTGIAVHIAARLCTIGNLSIASPPSEKRSSGCEPIRWSVWKLTRLLAATNGKPS
jgi:pimeloyl-ACP methyl ester carboxylesterase